VIFQIADCFPKEFEIASVIKNERNHKGSTMRFSSLILAISLAFFHSPGLAYEPVPTLSITGTGIASAPPDVATVLTGVESFAETAAGALAENSERMERILGVLSDAGIEAKDIQTSNLSVSPRYNDRKMRTEHQIAGYQVRNGLTVRVREIAALGEVLDAIVSTGANRIDAVSFGFADSTELRRAARIAAVKDARDTAEIYAAAAGVKLGEILSISDGSAAPQPRGGFAMADMARSAVPIATGESSISDTVRIVWELVQD
jgi:uncharacterized protein YggE